MKKYSIVQIGTGNVATHLSMALKIAGHSIVQLVGRTESNTSILAHKLDAPYVLSFNELDTSAHIYIISVPDAEIANVVSQMPRVKGIVVHTSGSTPNSILSSVSEQYGVFYPFQTFSKSRVVSFNDLPFCVEGSSSEVNETLAQLAKSIGSSPVNMDSEQRRWLHLMGVVSCNFVNHLWYIAEGIATRNGLSFNMVKPLVNETLAKAFEQGPLKSQTGPAIRGDTPTMEKHMEMLLSMKEEWSEIYKMLSQSIMDTKNSKSEK